MFSVQWIIDSREHITIEIHWKWHLETKHSCWWDVLFGIIIIIILFYFIWFEVELPFDFIKKKIFFYFRNSTIYKIWLILYLLYTM